MKKLLLLLTIVVSVAACSDDSDKLIGLWTADDVVKTFPGDTVLIKGQVSSNVGMNSVELTCTEWGISQKYELQGKHSKVFDYNYRMPVPDDATFDATMKITVTDINGNENKKTLTLVYLPDTQAPAITDDMPAQVSVDFDATAAMGILNLSLNATDDRGLKSLSISIPEFSYNETLSISGKSAKVEKSITLTQVGVFPMTVTITDLSDNSRVYNQQLVVMLAEDEDPFADYPVMWLVNATENPDDYLDGFYAPMLRQGEYQYQGSFYAPSDGYKLYVVPTKSMDADIFGVSPYVSSKLMNKRGYVQPITIETAGYYGLWIDLNAHSWSIWSLDTSAAYTGSLTVSGCGFNDFADWGLPAEEMNRNGFRYTYTLSQNGAYTGTRQYYAARVSDWGWILRWWSDASGCGWWVDDAGYGGQVGSYVSDYDGPVDITFDTAILWATVKKGTN